MDPSSTTDPSKRIIRIVVVTVSVLVAIVFFWPKAKERFEPSLVEAHVAIQTARSDVAIVGPVAIDPGEEFTLHAVLEAKGRGGEAVYYTEAPALQIGGKRIDGEALRRWDRPWLAKIFWFTVEGPAPYIEVKSLEHIDRVAFTEYFHLEWPLVWSVPGQLESRFDQSLVRNGSLVGSVAGRRVFGTQRYQVRIELFEDEDNLTPKLRLISPGGRELAAGAPDFPTVYAAYPGPAGPASLAFGLTQIEPVATPQEEPSAAKTANTDMIRRLAELTESRIFFSRLALIREVIQAAGLSPDEVTWTDVDLEEGPFWSGTAKAARSTKAQLLGVSRGDLLRAGGRVVVLYEDQGVEGRLDREDLCFDFEQGARVLRLSDVFEGQGLLELAVLHGGAGRTE